MNRAFGFVLVLCIMLAGCAHVEHYHQEGVTISEVSPRQEEFDHATMLLRRGTGGWLVSPTDGLTEIGCAILFPHNGGVDCLTTWHNKNFFERGVFLIVKVSPFIRGILQYLNEEDAKKMLRENAPAITAEELRVQLESLYGENSPFRCMLGTTLHMDFCVILFQRIATRGEVSAAIRQIHTYNERDALLTTH